MPASEETGSGPVIHDHRRIDPVTGQVRGKHAASKPAGTTGAGRPAGTGSSGSSGSSGTGSSGSGSSGTGTGSAGGASGGASGAAEAKNEPDEAETADATEEVMEGIIEDAPVSGQKQSDAEARLAERTADLQRLQAEYANYRKRVDRDRAAVREQAIATALTGLLPVLDAIDQAREHGELSGGFKSVADSLQSAVGKLGLVAYGEKGDAFDPKIHEALTATYSPDVTEDTCIEIFQPGYKVGEKILRPARVAVAEPATGPDGSSNEAAWPDGEEES
ncbi:MAG: nucleotide exchange factor GrpE [Streptosporangiaceae bacterium]